MCEKCEDAYKRAAEHRLNVSSTSPIDDVHACKESVKNQNVCSDPKTLKDLIEKPSGITVSDKPIGFEIEVRSLLKDLGDLLISKNRKYGDAALNPKRVFSKASSVEQIKVRIDDKLSRLANQQHDEDEDVIIDLMGYLVLLKIAQRRGK